MKTFFCQGAWFSSRRGASVHAFHKRCAVAVSVWLAVLMACAGASPQPSGTMHADGRGTTKLMFPTADGGAAAKGPQTADAFLKAHHGTFKVAEDLSNLELVTVRESLLGQHYRYRQVLNGVPVDGADLVVSIRRTSGQVYQAYNNTYPVQEKPVLSKTRVGAEAALDAAWQHLRVHGTLLSPLRAKLVYIPNQGGVFRLVYKTLVAVTAPFGYWEHQIDAVSGEVLSVRDTVIRRKGNPKTLPDFSAYTGEVWPRAKAVSEYELIALKRSQTVSNVSKTAVNGTAYVFEGDPRTYLADAALTNASVPEAFVAAYVQRPLQEISLSDGTYALAGPWVTIVDFEAPNTVPSTTTTGHWTSSRGNNAFNDVMTYYHIDQNQRYLQSLGYVGDTGIQYASIQADSDGVAGDDNSYYDPNGNRLSFGHGGVDDNEDADVILHEYGHAITYDIIPSWGGGDTGAIGEGFGDYWGASYSSTTTNGTTFHPEWAFSWDGHSADTWSGRFLNMTNLTYDAAHTYLDHESINGIDNYSDQLWGTPLVQAFQTLRERGCPREEIDKIMIESFFGIGSGPNLRDMANATVKAAMELFPDGPHASVFYEKFLNQLIVGLAPILTYPTGGESFATGSVVRVQWDRNNAPVHAYAQIEYTAQLSGPPAYFSDQVESGANGWVATKTSSGSSWVITNVNSHSATRCWFANDDEVIASQYLTKSALAVSNNAVLAFWHDYDLESGFDGGVVEISTDGGSTWIDIGTNATQNGYNMAIDTGYGSSLAGRPAFSGSSGGYVETRIPLTAYQGQTVALRFVEADDGTLAATGWWIDDVRIFVDDLQWTAVATTPTNTTGYAWTLPGTVGTDFGVRVKLAASNMTDSAWSVSQAFALKGLPSVTAWPAASPLVVGQALSESTLSGGSASTSGAFAFATPSWVLEAGMALHSVMFTPDDGVNYVAVSGAVNVVVAPVPVVSGFTVNGGVAGSVFRFEAVGGIQYRVRYSDSLSVPLSSWPWVTPPDDGWNSALTNGPFTISDPDATNSPTRFYRLEERAQ